jgi:hypothetical protein
MGVSSKDSRSRAMDQLFDAVDLASDTAKRLEDLAYAFARTGNDVVARELNDHVKDLKQVAQLVRQGAGQCNAFALQDAMQGSANVMAAALAGIALRDAESRLTTSAEHATKHDTNNGART